MKPPPPKIIPLLILILVGGLLTIKMLFREPFRYAGTIEATRIDVPARVTSVIERLHADEGDRVQAGQILMTFSCEDYKLAARLAEDNHARAEQLLAGGSLSRQDYDLIKNRKDDADLKVTWCTVSAPTDAVVLTRYHEPGEMVSPGTKLFTVADLQEVYAYFYVPQPNVARLKLGQKVLALLPELKNRTFEGTITWIADEAEFTPKNVQTREERTRLIFAIKVVFNNNDSILKPGMTIETNLPRE